MPFGRERPVPRLLSAALAVGLYFSAAALPAAAQNESVQPQTVSSAPAQAPSAGDVKRPSPPRYVQLGRSVKGTPIMAAVYGTGKKRVMIFGGIHGNETNTSILAKALMGSLGEVKGLEDLSVIIVPDVNPDGLFANTRTNARGVDINRNFPSTSWRSEYKDMNQFPGIEPKSEPETQAVLSLLEKSPPDFIITLHAALGCVNWDGPGEELARVISGVNGYPLCSYLGYETPGSLGTLMGIDKKLPVVTIELKGGRATKLVEENLPALKAVLAYIASK